MEEDNIQRLEFDGKEIILIPTAHISKKSAEQVKEVIETEEPDSVCVELDQQRYESIDNEDKWSEMNIFQVIKEKKSLLLLVNLIISSFQSRMAEKLGINAGEEMRQGIKSAKEIGAELVLADRNIQITFKRVWRGLGLWEKMKLIFQIISMLFVDEEITEEEMDQLKSGDALNIMLEEMGKSFPGIKKYLLDERDQYLANKIKNAPGDKIIAVLGAAHVPGVKKEIYKEQNLAKITKLPPKPKWGKLFSW
ncbi:MAG: TraB/GumN family protein, partial [Halanaerobium sp.]